MDFAWGDPETNAAMGDDDDDENASDAPPLAIMDGSVSDDDGDQNGPVPTTPVRHEGESARYMSDDEDVAVVPDDSQDIFMDPIPNNSVPMATQEMPMDSQENEKSPMDSKEIPMDSQEIPMDSQENEESPMDSEEIPMDSQENEESPMDSKEIPMDSQEEGPMWTDLADSQPDPRPPATWDDLTVDSPGPSTDLPEQPSSASISMPPPPPIDPQVLQRKMEIRVRMEELRFGLQNMFL